MKTMHMRASSEPQHAEEGEAAGLVIKRSYRQKGKLGTAVSSSQGRKVCGEEEVVGSVRPRPQTSGMWS